MTRRGTRPPPGPRWKPRWPTPTGLSARIRAELAGALKIKPAFNRLLRTTAAGKLRIDPAAVAREAFFDGRFLLRTFDETLSAGCIAEGYKCLHEAAGWRCFSSASFRSNSPTPGATSATNWNACIWSPRARPKAPSPNVASSPPGTRRSSAGLHLPELPRFHDFAPLNS